MALQSEHFWSFNILTKNIFARPILYVYYAQKISKLPKHFWMYSGALRIGTIFFFQIGMAQSNNQSALHPFWFKWPLGAAASYTFFRLSHITKCIWVSFYGLTGQMFCVFKPRLYHLFLVCTHLLSKRNFAIWTLSLSNIAIFSQCRNKLWPDCSFVYSGPRRQNPFHFLHVSRKQTPFGNWVSFESVLILPGL